ncbi:hypothetical protein NIA69_11685 [Gemmiger formicilis]|nr:hypothetical protein [Gemmiger formicilis]
MTLRGGLWAGRPTIPGERVPPYGASGTPPLQGAPRTFRGPRPNGIPFLVCIAGRGLDPPRRPVGRPPYDLPGSACRHAGVGDAAPTRCAAL